MPRISAIASTCLSNRLHFRQPPADHISKFNQKAWPGEGQGEQYLEIIAKASLVTAPAGARDRGLKQRRDESSPPGDAGPRARKTAFLSLLSKLDARPRIFRPPLSRHRQAPRKL